MELFLDTYKNMYGKAGGKRPGQQGYYLAKCREYYSEYASESGSLLAANFAQGASRRSAKELRDYGRNLQPVEKYLSQIGYAKKDIEKFKKKNISYAPPAIYPKFRNIIHSKFTDLNVKPSTEAMDESANVERMYMKNRMKLLRQEETRMAVPPGTMPEDGMKAMESPEDIEYLYGIGEIRLDVEIMAKDAVDITMEKSKWPTINKMLVEDYIDLGGMACDQYVRNGTLVVDYIDYARVIVRPSIYPDFRDSDVRGYVRSRKVSEVMQIDPTIEQHWDALKDSYYTQRGMRHSDYHKGHGIREDYADKGRWSALGNDFGITEVKFYWLDVEEMWFVKGRHPRGSRIFEKVEPGFSLSERAVRAGKVLEKYMVQRMYQATHILGTDIVYDAGPVEAAERMTGEQEVDFVWPMQIYSAQEPSLTEKVIPFVDDATIAMYKRRDVMSKIPPGPRMVLYKNRIRESITMGGEDYTLRDLMQMYYREGLLIVDEEEPYTIPGEQASQGRPIDFIPAGVTEDIQIAETTIQSSIARIRDITGINEIVDGSASQPDMLKSVVENLKLAANNALRPWLEGYVEFYRGIVSSLVWRYQRLAAAGERNLGMLPMTHGTSRLVKLGPDLARYNFNIKVEVNDSQYYQFLMQDLMAKRELLPVEAYFTIYNALNQGDLRKAELYLMKFSQKGQEAQHKRQMEIAQANAEANARAAQATEQERQRTMQMELGLKGQLYEKEYAAKDMLAANDHLRRLEEIEHTKKLEKDIAVSTTEANNASRLTQ